MPPPTPRSALTKPETTPIATSLAKERQAFSSRRSGPSSTETASVSSAILSANGEQVRLGDPEADPVGDLEPAVLAELLHGADQVVHARLEAELVVERRSRSRR